MYRALSIPVILAGVLVLGGPLAGCQKKSPPPPLDSPADVIWFDTLGPPLPLEEVDATTMASHVQARLTAATPANAPTLGSSWRSFVEKDRAPRIAFLSLSSGRGPAVVAMGRGRGLVAALDDASARLQEICSTQSCPDPLESPGPGTAPGALSHDTAPSGSWPDPPWLVIDVVDRADSRTLRWRDALALEPGVHGVAWTPASDLAILPGEILVHRLRSKDGTLRRDRVRAVIDRSRRRGNGAERDLLAHDGSFTVHRFTTTSFFIAAGRATALFRGHRRTIPVTPAELTPAIAQGASYLARMVARDGRFTYSYAAERDRARKRYNMVRHAGTIFAMLQAWRALGDPHHRHVRVSAERAIDHLVRHIDPFGPPELAASALAYRKKIKLGGVALAALALATHVEFTGQPTYLALAQRLCRYIRHSQRPDGSFVHQRHHPGGEPRDFISQYYPGEAILALTAMHRLDRDPAWLDAAEAGARHLIEVRDRGIATADLVHDHWLLYALEALYRQRSQPLYLEHAMRIAQAIIGKQRRAEDLAGLPIHRDHLGSYSHQPRSTPVATRSEGLLAAHALARDVERPEMATKILEAVALGTRFQLITQIDPARAIHLPDPARALGGFTRSLESFEVRIDYVQHNLSALIALRHILERDTGERDARERDARERDARPPAPPPTP